MMKNLEVLYNKQPVQPEVQPEIDAFLLKSTALFALFNCRNLGVLKKNGLTWPLHGCFLSEYGFLAHFRYENSERETDRVIFDRERGSAREGVARERGSARGWHNRTPQLTHARSLALNGCPLKERPPMRVFISRGAKQRIVLGWTCSVPGSAFSTSSSKTCDESASRKETKRSGRATLGPPQGQSRNARLHLI